MVLSIVNHMNETEPTREYDFLEGELETLLLEYWRLQSIDLKNIDKGKMKNIHTHFNETFNYTCTLLLKLNENFNENALQREKTTVMASSLAMVHPAKISNT